MTIVAMSTTGYAYAPSIGIPCAAATITSEPITLLNKEALPGFLVYSVILPFQPSSPQISVRISSIS
ncbi:MAG: hypothetical protein V7K46_17610 [Nostoc sp.]